MTLSREEGEPILLQKRWLILLPSIAPPGTRGRGGTGESIEGKGWVTRGPDTGKCVYRSTTGHLTDSHLTVGGWTPTWSMWAADLSVCAHHCRGALWFSSEAWVTKHMHNLVCGSLIRKGNRLALRLSVMTGLFLCVFSIFLWILNPPLGEETLVCT